MSGLLFYVVVHYVQMHLLTMAAAGLILGNESIDRTGREVMRSSTSIFNQKNE